MSTYMDRVRATLKAGAEDLARGVQGKETGDRESMSVSLSGVSLGLTVSDFGGEALISAVVAGGEAAAQGVELNDRITSVGGLATESYAEVVSAIRRQSARPLSLTLERRVKRDDTGPGFVSFRLDEEVDKAERILRLMLASPRSGPPPEILERARGLAFLRVTKVGFALSGRFGTGLVVARLPGGWSAPSAIGTVGASLGFQLGAQIADFLVVLNTDQAVAAFSEGGQVTVGGQVGAVAGPVGAGREAALAAAPGAAAPVYTYSVSKGLFAGVSLEGSVINERVAVNERHYASPGIRAKHILSGQVRPMPACARLHTVLHQIGASTAPPVLHVFDPAVPAPVDDDVPDSNPFITTDADRG